MSIETAVVLGLAAISGTLAYLSLHMDKEQHGVLQVLFLMMSLWVGLADIGVISQLIVQEATYTVLSPILVSITTVYMWGTILVVFYMFINFTWNLFHKFQEWKQKKKTERLGIESGMGVGQ